MGSGEQLGDGKIVMGGQIRVEDCVIFSVMETTCKESISEDDIA